jgi:hypothetical protein
LAIDRLKDAFAGSGLDKAFLKGSDRRPIWNLAADAQPRKALKTQAVEQLKFHLFVAQIEQPLDQQDPNHQFGRKW